MDDKIKDDEILNENETEETQENLEDPGTSDSQEDLEGLESQEGSSTMPAM